MMLAVLIVSLCAALTGQIADGVKLYDSTKHVCCNATLTDRTAANSICCGDKAYDLEKFMCCNNEIVPIPDGGKSFEYGCCLDGNAVYKFATELCCKGKVIKKDDSDAVIDCCGDKPYRWEEAICCDEQLYPLAANESSAQKGCCGGKAYNYEEFSCCNDKLVEQTGPSSGCCGEKTYDYEKQLCCTSFPKDDFNLKNAKNAIVAKNGPTTTCCGTQSYNYETEVCCNEKVKPKPASLSKDSFAMCCGDDFITDFETQICCNDKLISKPNSATSCCGDKAYNILVETCCNDQVHPKQRGIECCWGAKKLYDTETEYCCREDVVELTDDDKKNGRSSCCEADIPFPIILHSGPGFAGGSSPN